VQLREAAFGLLLRDRAPVAADRLAELVDTDQGRVVAALEAMELAGRIDRDAEGCVLGSAGLTLADGPHRLQLGGYAFRTWCAFDALGIPAALAADARVETACAVCGRSISVEMEAGRTGGGGEARLWLSAGGADLRADFCRPTVMLCTEDHVWVWAERQAGRGSALTLAEATEEGARSWRSAAATATRLLAGTT
jgi:alkylmercury lyase